MFTKNFGVEYLTLILLIVSELEQRGSSKVNYAGYAKQLKERIMQDVLQFSDNHTSPELDFYFERKVDDAFVLRLKDLLSKSV